MDPKVEELLTYILSKQGQAQVTREADYLPLTLEVAAHSLEELRRRHTVANP